MFCFPALNGRLRKALQIAVVAVVFHGFLNPVCSRAQMTLSLDSPLGLDSSATTNLPEVAPPPIVPPVSTRPVDRPTSREVYSRILRSTVCLRIKQPDGGEQTGTGWVLDAQRRLIVTNQHVVDQYETVSLYFPQFSNGEVVSDPAAYRGPGVVGRVVDSDISRDLALVQAEELPSGTTAIPLASRSADPGERVHSIAGVPNGSGGYWVYSNGHIRVITRTDLANGHVTHVAESDIPINCGNSGGPIVNDAGRLIAVAEGTVTNARLVSLLVDIRAVREYLGAALPLIESDRPEQKLELARRHRKEGRFATAARLLSAVLRQRPESAAAYAERGWTLLGLEDAETAILDFDRAHKLDPHDAGALRGRAMARCANGDHKAGIRDFTAAISLTPTDWELYNRRGVARFSIEQYEAAVADFSRALKYAPNESQVYANRGHALQELSRLDESLADFDEALKRDERNDGVWYLAGVSFYKQKNFKQSVNAFANASRLDESNAKYVLRMGDALQEAGEHDKAIEAFTRSIDLAASSTAYFFRGLSYRAIDDPAKAVADLTQAIEMQPQNAAYYYHRGLALKAVDRNDEAQRDLRRAAQLDPEKYARQKPPVDRVDDRQTTDSQASGNPFVGTWQATVNLAAGRLTITTAMDANGRWVCRCRGQMHNGASMTVEDGGTYKFDAGEVHFVDDTETTVRGYKVERNGISFQFPEFGGWVMFVRVAE